MTCSSGAIRTGRSAPASPMRGRTWLVRGVGNSGVTGPRAPARIPPRRPRQLWVAPVNCPQSAQRRRTPAAAAWTASRYWNAGLPWMRSRYTWSGSVAGAELLGDRGRHLPVGQHRPFGGDDLQPPGSRGGTRSRRRPSSRWLWTYRWSSMSSRRPSGLSGRAASAARPCRVRGSNGSPGQARRCSSVARACRPVGASAGRVRSWPVRRGRAPRCGRPRWPGGRPSAGRPGWPGPGSVRRRRPCPPVGSGRPG